MPEGPLGLNRPAAQPIVEISISFSSSINSSELSKLDNFKEKTALIDFLDSIVPNVGDQDTDFGVRDIEINSDVGSVKILTDRNTITSRMLLDIESWMETEIGQVNSVTVVAK